MISVIISTYNQPVWLEKVLWGYEQQTCHNFELVIADDGSKEDTRVLIEEIKQRVSYPIKHVWHEDQGFRKTEILNKAIMASQGEYLLFSDGDCIPRRDFVETHLLRRRKGCFLSGGYYKLTMPVSEAITLEDIKNGRCFDINWLHEAGQPASFKDHKLTAKGMTEVLLNKLTPTKATWNGHNASGWREDILQANGFDERMQYGGEDRELGERLMNAGLHGIQIRYSAIVIHLDHSRGYVTQEALQKNRAIRDVTKKQRLKRTEWGIDKG